MTRLGAHPPATVVLAVAACVGLIVLGAVFLPSLVFVPEERAAAAPDIGKLVLPVTDRRPFEDYSSVIKHPLFNPGRKEDPPPPAEAAKSQLPPLSDYRLVGVVIGRGSKLALVERRSAKQVVTVHPGDDLDGRLVEDIKEDGVAFSGGPAPEMLTIPRAAGFSRKARADHP